MIDKQNHEYKELSIGLLMIVACLIMFGAFVGWAFIIASIFNVSIVIGVMIMGLIVFAFFVYMTKFI